MVERKMLDWMAVVRCPTCRSMGLHVGFFSVWMRDKEAEGICVFCFETVTIGELVDGAVVMMNSIGMGVVRMWE